MTAVTAPAARRRLIVAEDSVPTLARGTRLRYDEARQRWVLLVPERVMAPDEIAVEILQLCDGRRSVADIIDHLAAAYAAPRDEIGTDVIAMLQDLAGSGFVVEARKATP
ncbi:MAG: pyrroloquinoline quinone biosynthesis peptide chaperone PqqD [Devosia sp.]|nr:pyrroloquinoline quinone biosynthesis peptide chaperone PqqD [Devosia sp.]